MSANAVSWVLDLAWARSRCECPTVTKLSHKWITVEYRDHAVYIVGNCCNIWNMQSDYIILPIVCTFPLDQKDIFFETLERITILKSCCLWLHLLRFVDHDGHWWPPVLFVAKERKPSDKPKGPVLIRRGAADAVEVWAEILVEPQPKSRIKHMHTHIYIYIYIIYNI